MSKKGGEGGGHRQSKKFHCKFTHTYKFSGKKRNVISKKGQGGGVKAVWKFSKKTSIFGETDVPRGQEIFIFIKDISSLWQLHTRQLPASWCANKPMTFFSTVWIRPTRGWGWTVPANEIRPSSPAGTVATVHRSAFQNIDHQMGVLPTVLQLKPIKLPPTTINLA